MTPNFIRTFLQQGYWGGISVLAKMGGSLAMNKMLALAFGPSGIAWHAQMLGIFNLFILLPNEGLIRGAVVLEKSGHKALTWAWSLSLALLALLTTALSLLPESWVGLPWGWPERIGIGLCAAFYIMHLCLLGLAHAKEKYAQISLLGALGNVLGALLMGASLALSLPVSITLLMLPAGLGLALLASVFFLREENAHLWSQQAQSSALRPILLFALPALGSLFFEHLLYYAARSHSLQHWGAAQTGIWQAGSTLASYYTALYIAGPIAVVYPHLLLLKHHPEEGKKYLLQAASWIVPGIWLGLGLIALLRQPTLSLLFSKDLPVEAGDSLLWQLASDAIRLPGFLLAYWLIVQEKPKVILASQIGNAIGYGLGLYWAVGALGPIGYAAAHLGGSLVSVWVMWWGGKYGTHNHL